VLHGVDVSDSRFLSRPRVLCAVEFAAHAHRGQTRKTGDPYVAHCLETALIVERLLSPSEEDTRAENAVVAALLHDVIDDAGILHSEIEDLFGVAVADMVTKVSQLSQTHQLIRRRLRLAAEERSKDGDAALRRMILAMADEPLAIVVKLADRLHNMRTVYALGPEKQRAVASETRRVWCSLAERLGMFALRGELEDLCFAVLQPAEYRVLRAEVDAMCGIQTIPPQAMTPTDCCLSGECACGFQEGDKEAVDLEQHQMETKELVESVLPFDASTFNMRRLRIPPSALRGLEVLQGCARALLQEITTEGVASGLEVSVQGRVKSLYSIFKKMARKGVPLSSVYDARALRVVVSDAGGALEREAIAACYKLQPAVHRLWRRISGEDDDYIASPKPSGYQSLHTAVVGPGGVALEVQIRTSSMHEVAEYGRAAHWAYKERPKGGAAPNQVEKGPESIRPGHPLLQISSDGQFSDAVVIDAEDGGMRLVAAVSLLARRFGGAAPAAAEEYATMLRHVEDRGFFAPGHGDLTVSLQRYTLCSDGKYHKLDHLGHKVSAAVVPLRAEAVAAEGADAAGPEMGSAPTAQEGELAFMSNKIRLLRSMLEWGDDLVGPSPDAQEGMAAAAIMPPEAEAALPRADVMVMFWPSGKILRLPRGTTAGSALRTEGANAPSEPLDEEPVGMPAIVMASGARALRRLVNVNNRLVPEDTTLVDGDYVVVGRQPLKI
jgi:ppGpp synthetase/RelA/SpoT-type nucleotidyltranferase